MPNGMYGGVRGERKSPLLDLKHFDTLYPMQSAGAVYWEVVIVKKGKNEYIQIRNTLSKKARLLQGVITAIYMNCQII